MPSTPMGDSGCNEETLVAVALLEDEYCPNCGEWVFYLNFNYEAGWCNECTQDSDHQPRCIHCGTVLENTHRTTCHTCRKELWLERHADELEYLVVCKGYTVAQAKSRIAKMIRPLCQACRKPIDGAKEGALFHRNKQKCLRWYTRYRTLQRQGLTSLDALAIIREELENQGGTSDTTTFRTLDY